MRIVETKVYKFKELSEQAKEKAIESYRDINVQHEWYDGTFEIFKETMNDLGFDVDKMYFSGFWSQGDGAMFEGSLNDNIKYRLDDVLEKHMRSSKKNWNRVEKLIKDGFINLNGSFSHAGRYYHEKSYDDSLSCEYQCDYSLNLSNIEDILDDMLECIREMYEDHCRQLYSDLEKEHEYYTSDNEVAETIICNDYEFTKEGEQF